MSKTKNSVDSLVNQLGGRNSRTPANTGSIASSLKSSDMKLESASTVSRVSEIQFGKAPASAISAKSTSHPMSALLRAATGNMSSAASGLLGSGGLLGIGSLVSGLFSLFGGGKSTLPALSPFEMPESIQRQLSAGSNSVTSQAGSGSGGAYGSLPDHTNNSQWLMQQNQQVAAAVKTALLQSSSLADVINEL